ncbi:MAG TPA: STAS domain-containing protein [Anaerolineales bacterium]|nr:STAS domain-containing protein [Anaerolineales bacterium]
MQLKVTNETARVPVTVVHVDGNIDSASYESFLAGLEDAINGGARHILLDLSHVPFVSSAGLRALNIVLTRLRTLTPDVSDVEMRKGINDGTYKSPHLKLLNPSKETLTTMETSGFSMFIETFHDLKTALAAF